MLLSSFCFLTGTMSELQSPREGTCVMEETVRSFVDRQNLTCSEDIRIEMGSGIEGRGGGGICFQSWKFSQEQRFRLGSPPYASGSDNN